MLEELTLDTVNLSEPTEFQAFQGPSSSGPSNPVDFENLGGKAPEALEGEEAPPEPAFEVIPFTDEEIVKGSAFLAVVLGENVFNFLDDKEDLQAFQAAFLKFSPLALSTLKLGDALASYGIGQNSLPGLGTVEAMPAWARLAAGGVVIGVSVFMGAQAVEKSRHARAVEVEKKTIDTKPKKRDKDDDNKDEDSSGQ
jgi:hypothetical protein